MKLTFTRGIAICPHKTQRSFFIFQWWWRKLYLIYKSLWIHIDYWLLSPNDIGWLWGILCHFTKQVSKIYAINTPSQVYYFLFSTFIVKSIFQMIVIFRLLVWVTAYEDSQNTKPEVLWENLTKSLNEIHDLFKSILPTSQQ